ncbi:MAG: EamA family transporter RarD [Hyphomonadaceae bacterium]
MATPSTSYTKEDVRAGFIAAFAAYTIWGLLPLYLMLVSFADPREILGQRIIWAAPACLIGIFAISGWRRGLSELRGAMRPALIATLALSAVFIFINWAIYVWAVANERVISAALAYFLAPLVQVAVGVGFYGEKLSRWQIAALALAGIGVIVQGVALGAFPWVSLALCATWCAYGVVRKRAVVPAATGLFIETAILLPVAAGLLYWVGAATLRFDDSMGYGALLALAGPATAIPLTLFAFGARRLSFTTIGLLQFIAPTIQFLIGVIAGEPLTALRIASFGFIWAGLALFSYDVWRRERG